MDGGFDAPMLVKKTLVPSADIAAEDQGSGSFPGNVCIQVLPESVDV